MTGTLEERVAALEGRLLAIERRLEAPAHRERPKDGTPTPREFLLDKIPKGDNDTTLAAGYYLEMVAGNESFTFDDLADFYNKAKEAMPANRRDPPYQNVRRGYFREIGPREGGKTARNRWAVTNLGIARVESGFKKGTRE